LFLKDSYWKGKKKIRRGVGLQKLGWVHLNWGPTILKSSPKKKRFQDPSKAVAWTT